MKKKIYRFVSLFTVINLLLDIFIPSISYALTSGPSQPEHVQFAPVGANNSVDLFSGDFSYNIPLFELPGPDGGYPFNLTYQAGSGVEEEASWVGLGFNLTPGAINRQMRGLPDEFKGDIIEQKLEKLDNVTNSFSLGGNIALELLGFEKDKYDKLRKALAKAKIADVNIGPNVGLTLSFQDNNYTGVGYSFTPSFGYGMSIVSNALKSANIKLGYSGSHSITLSSDNGTSTTNSQSVNLDIVSAEGHAKDDTDKYTVGYVAMESGIGFTRSRSRNSREGLLSTSYELSLSTKRAKYFNPIEGGDVTSSRGVNGGLSLGWTLNHTNSGYMPTINTPTIAESASYLAKIAFAFNPSYSGSFNVGGSISTQKINYDDKDARLLKSSAYGYNHSDNTSGLMDLNRERDKVIDKETKSLPAPNFTYDTYMVTGQGLSGMFRPYRGEVGVLGDNHTKSVTRGGSLGGDLPIFKPDHWGVNLDITGGSSTSGKSTAFSKYKFEKKKKGSLFEPVYYKFQGEASIMPLSALDKIGNHLPIRFEMTNEGVPIESKLVYSQVEDDIDKATTISATSSATGGDASVIKTKEAKLDKYFNANRNSRNTLIQEITNEQVTALPEYTVQYRSGYAAEYDNNPLDFTPVVRFTPVSLKRQAQIQGNETTNKHLKPYHLAGFTCTNAGGSRYVYGLPAYNYSQTEAVESYSRETGNQSHKATLTDELNTTGGKDPTNGYQKGTELYTNETKTPAYPYAYLLTSIMGTDYIDVDYDTHPGISKNDLGYWVKFNYARAHSNYTWRSPYEGVNFTEGLRSTDTDDKISYSHGQKDIWYMDIVETKSHIAVFRTSPREDGIGATTTSIKGGKDFDKKLRKLDKISLYTRYEYEKAQNSDNNSYVPVPIKEIHFAYSYELCKGTPNGAEFESKGKLTLKKVWFTYQGVSRGELNPYEFTYYNPNYSPNAQDRWGSFAPRDENKTHAAFPYVDQTADHNSNASAWNLKTISMPTGSQMHIEYESDDYAYVQDKTAMQMENFSLSTTPFSGENEEGEEDISQDNLKVYFKLTSQDAALASTLVSAAEKTALANKYLDDRNQVYFKTLISLRNDKDYEEMTSYLDIDPSSSSRGIHTTSSGQNYGYFTLLPAKGRNNSEYHPLIVAAWMKLKTEHPRLLLPGNDMNDGFGNNPAFGNITQVLSTFRSLRERYKNYYTIANQEGWGKKIKIKQSYIRLNNTIGKKYGGGYRVKKVEFWDGTGSEPSAESTYGQEYEYTTKDENGNTVSSGVASYEPLAGGDENALRYAEKYKKAIPTGLKALTDYDFFVEYPINEGYYPGAQVGYSKVTVKSIATADKIRQVEQGINGSYPADIATTGITINEFYTTKDFPTLAAQTDVDHQEKRKTTHNLFPMAVKTTQKSGMSQGFVVELNNMNGKPKSMQHFGQNDQGVVQYDKPISSSEYIYKTMQRGNKTVLDNKCEVLVEEKNGIIKKEKRLVGVEYDVFIDSRKMTTNTFRAGNNFNLTLLDILPTPAKFPIPTYFYSSSSSEEEVHITTINKIIYRSGILDSVRVSDGLSVSTTNNLLWDAYTGGVLLTSVNNNFEDKIYSYTIPAYTQYDDMGAAYRNAGLTFNLSGGNYTNTGGRMYNFVAPIPNAMWVSELVPGDELIVKGATDTNPKKAIYMGADRETRKLQFFILNAPTDNSFPGILDCTIIRSGRRNLIAASAGNITSLKNPTSDAGNNRKKKTFAGQSIITKKK